MDPTTVTDSAPQLGCNFHQHANTMFRSKPAPMSAGELVRAMWIASLAHASHRNDGGGLTAATVVSPMSCDRLDQRIKCLRSICNQSVGGAGAPKCNAVQRVIATALVWRARDCLRATL